jgi:hypothetical protein
MSCGVAAGGRISIDMLNLRCAAYRRMTGFRTSDHIDRRHYLPCCCLMHHVAMVWDKPEGAFRPLNLQRG